MTRSIEPSVHDSDWVHAVWDGEGVGARVARGALLPAAMLFEAIGAVRSSMYASGVLATRPTAVPALSVGNLTVGGTGKTPLAAFLARRLRDQDAKPAIVLRGYGEDEPLVHRVLNPDVPVIVSPDRIAGSTQAEQQGCDVVVLDDAFQHRRASRVADIVVIGADGWHDTRQHLLPAGPWRERLSAARRATLVVVSRKAASRERAVEIAATVERVAGIPTAIVCLETSDLREVGGDATLSSASLAGRSVLSITGIGNPDAFHAQLAAHGATVEPVVFRDHHRFTHADATTLAARAARHDLVVCTLKDAVKLGPLWPGPSRLWYVSQRVAIETGGAALDAVLDTTLHARFA